MTQYDSALGMFLSYPCLYQCQLGLLLCFLCCVFNVRLICFSGFIYITYVDAPHGNDDDDHAKAFFQFLSSDEEHSS